MKAMGKESPIPHAPSALVNLTVSHAARGRSRRHSFVQRDFFAHRVLTSRSCCGLGAATREKALFIMSSGGGRPRG